MMRALALIIILCLSCATATAGQRIALLIGNQNYKPGVGRLKNPFNDIQLVANALRRVGFTVLPVVKDATRAQILAALELYTSTLRKAGPDAIGFVYYSGHGIAARGKNYIIPVDVEKPSTELLRAYGVAQAEILTLLQADAPNAAHYLIIDACRNELLGSRGGKGFLPVTQHQGTLIAFATAPGATASDQGNGGGPYAKALSAEIVKPGIPDLLMFHNVRYSVMRATGGDQVPWTLDGIGREKRVMFGGQKFSLQSGPAQPKARPKEKPKPSEPVLSGRALIVQLQLQLLNRDCMEGRVGKVGKFDDATVQGLRRFAYLAKSPIHWHRPTMAALRVMRAMPTDRACASPSTNAVGATCAKFSGDRFCY